MELFWVFFDKRGAEQSMGLLGARMYPPGEEGRGEGDKRDPIAQRTRRRGWGEDGGRGGTRTRGRAGLRMRGAKGGGHTQPIVSG